MDKFAAGKGRTRKYRNCGAGEFFKEIDLLEKQGTGMLTILSELKKTGSPLLESEMEEERTYLIVTIRTRDIFE